MTTTTDTRPFPINELTGVPLVDDTSPLEDAAWLDWASKQTPEEN